MAGGIVCELGSALSHGAVVAREYGVPAVLRVPAVTTTVQDGERLRVDGDRGLVERLDA
jgi:pyruvate,water dikinase